jgi:hypothetical protein
VSMPRWMAASKAAFWPGWMRMSAISRIIVGSCGSDASSL